MPLFNIDDPDHPVTSIPYEKDFNIVRARLTDQEYQAIVDELSQRVASNEVNTAGWMPGKYWDGTVFMPIYLACRENEEVAARFFGQLVWKLFMDRPEDWSSGRYEKDGIPISSRTYFRIRKK